jgi:hypothetical protein
LGTLGELEEQLNPKAEFIIDVMQIQRIRLTLRHGFEEAVIGLNCSARRIATKIVIKKMRGDGVLLS